MEHKGMSTNEQAELYRVLDEKTQSRYRSRESLGSELVREHIRDKVWTFLDDSHVFCSATCFPEEFIESLGRGNGSYDEGRYRIYLKDGFVHFAGCDGLGGLMHLVPYFGGKWTA